jgi:hypothetical protein
LSARLIISFTIFSKILTITIKSLHQNKENNCVLIEEAENPEKNGENRIKSDF